MKKTIPQKIMHENTSLPVLLLITSDAEKIKFFKTACKSSHYIVHTPYGVTAIDYTHRMDIEVIIIDIATLDESLFTFCTQIRTADETEKKPILLITNIIKKSFIVEALKAGATDFLREPLEEQELYARLAVAKNSSLISQKIALVSSKISSSPLMPQNTNLFSDRILLSTEEMSAIENVKKSDTPAQILMIEVDKIADLIEQLEEAQVEKINIVIKRFFEQTLRQFDALLPQGRGRYLLILPKTSLNAAKIIAEDLRKEINKTSIPIGTKEARVTISIGIVSFNKKPDDTQEAYEQFHQSLNSVKKCLKKAQQQGNTTIYDDS